MFIVLLTFNGSSATKCKQRTMCARSALVDLNLIELNDHAFMISLGKCNWNCNAVNDLFIEL